MFIKHEKRCHNTEFMKPDRRLEDLYENTTLIKLINNHTIKIFDILAKGLSQL